MSTCAYCDAELGTNEQMPELPARRVAFDPASQRVWSVCPRCSRWTLALLDPDERSRMVEMLERRYVAGAHAANVALGVAPLGDGTMVRVGNASWSQFASWRYGRKMRRQRRNAWLINLVSWPVVIWLWTPQGKAAVESDTGSWMIVPIALALFFAFRWHPVLRPRTNNGKRAGVSVLQAAKARVEIGADGWRVVTPSSDGLSVLEGAEAVRALARLLPLMHRAGATEKQVREAISLIEEVGGPEKLVSRLLSAQGLGVGRHELRVLPKRLMLALEMASNEETELASLRGEMVGISLDLKEATQTAAIAEEL